MLTGIRLRVFLSVIAAFFAVVSYSSLYSPLTSKLKAASSKSKAVESEVLQARETLAASAAFAMKKKLITEKDIPAAIDEITRRGKSKGVNFVSMTPGRVEPASNLRCRILSIQMEMESTFEEMGAFLGVLEELEKSFVTVRQLHVLPDTKDPAKLAARLTINMYFSAKEDAK